MFKFSSCFSWIPFILVFLISSGTSYTLKAQSFELTSPDKNLEVKISIGEEISFQIYVEGTRILDKASIDLVFEGIDFPIRQVEVISSSLLKRSYDINSPFNTKFSSLKGEYVELILMLNQAYNLEFRAYNDGIAYRFFSTQNQEVLVLNEKAEFKFPEASFLYFPEEKSMISHNERLYEHIQINAIKQDAFCSLPFLVEPTKKVKICFTESNLSDYPGLFMKKTGTNTLQAIFHKVPLEIEREEGKRWDRNEIITKEAHYIAKTTGNRSFPWRIFVIGQEKELMESTLPYLLAPKSNLTNTAWIKSGQVAWDWYNANNIYGVDFESGLNTKTYKYYIDFASKYGIEYIILDEGWTKSTIDIRGTNPDINLEQLIAYGKEKGVKIILWVLWKPLSKDIDGILSLYEKWGAAGIKVDFMQRSDQLMVNYYRQVAESAAKHHLLVDFHGSFKPSGLHREFPNVMTYEGVKGNENNKWAQYVTPDHNLTIPFIRMLAGPMDYTPGAMSNAQLDEHHISFNRPVGLGTRCHEISKYIIYESPLQMLCDTPSSYLKDKETVEFITQIPVLWDETLLIEGKIGDYLLLARRKGKDWYLAAMTDWTARNFTLDLDFLNEGKYEIQIMQDGINADKFAEDYQFVSGIVTQGNQLPIRTAKGGGWAAILKKK